MPFKKHIPERSCIACGKVRPKRELIRIVSSNGIINIDTAGKKAGRGAYLCPAAECWETGLKDNRLERTLRAAVSRDNKEQLARYGKNLRS